MCIWKFWSEFDSESQRMNGYILENGYDTHDKKIDGIEYVDGYEPLDACVCAYEPSATSWNNNNSTSELQEATQQQTSCSLIFLLKRENLEAKAQQMEEQSDRMMSKEMTNWKLSFMHTNYQLIWHCPVTLVGPKFTNNQIHSWIWIACITMSFWSFLNFTLDLSKTTDSGFVFEWFMKLSIILIFGFKLLWLFIFSDTLQINMITAGHATRTRQPD